MCSYELGTDGCRPRPLPCHRPPGSLDLACWSSLDPLRVISNEGNQYSLLDLITGKEQLYHVTQLKAFHFNPLKTDPVDVARKDYLEFFIESITDLEGSFDKLATLRFRIKWLGYNETHNTWEPWKNLRKTTALHQFLIARQLRHRIQKEFQSLYPE